MKNKLLKFFREYHIFFISFIFICSRKIFVNIMDSNELDTLVIAKHFMNPQWIANDWYLNLGIGYRYFFNFITGSMALIMPLWIVSIIGRIFVIAFFSFLIQLFAKHFKIKYYFILLFMLFYFLFPSIVAKEWMLGMFDTKCFAYIFALLALYAFLNKKYIIVFISLGFSLSFHILVGFYSLYSLFFTGLLNFNEYKIDIKKIIFSSFFYFISGFLGIFSILKTFFDNKDPELIKIGSDIYVNYRVSQHVLPSAWEGSWQIIFIFYLLILILAFIFINNRSIKIFAGFALGSATLFLIGLLLYYTKMTAYLKYYWFRLPDVIMPFTSFFIIAYFLNNILENKISIIQNKIFKRAINYFFIALSVVILLFSLKTLVLGTKYLITLGKEFYLHKDEPELINAMYWIRNNTDKNCQVLSDPKNACFYLVSERAQFVSFKHSPQSEKDIVEWYNRLKLCKYVTTNNENNEKINFYTMKEENIQEIVKNYNMNYLLTKHKKEYNYLKVFENKEYIIYKLK